MPRLEDFAKEQGFKVQDNKILLHLGKICDIEYGVFIDLWQNFQETPLLHPYVLKDGKLNKSGKEITCYTPEMVIKTAEVGDKSYVIKKREYGSVNKLGGLILAFKFRDLGTIDLDIIKNIYKGILKGLPSDVAGGLVADKMSELEEKLAEVEAYELPESETITNNILSEVDIYLDMAARTPKLPRTEIPTILEHLIVNKSIAKAKRFANLFRCSLDGVVERACYKLIRNGEIIYAKTFTENYNIEVNFDPENIQELNHRFLEIGKYDSIALLEEWSGIKPEFKEELVQRIYQKLAGKQNLDAIGKIRRETGFAPEIRLKQEILKVNFKELIDKRDFAAAQKFAELTNSKAELKDYIRGICIDLLRDKFINSAEEFLEMTSNHSDWLPNEIVQSCYDHWFKKFQFDLPLKLKELTGIGPDGRTLVAACEFYAIRGYWELGINKLKKSFPKEYHEHYDLIRAKINKV